MSDLASQFQRLNNKLSQCNDLKVEGKLVRMVGMTLEAVGVKAPIGAKFLINTDQQTPVAAEVVGFSDDKLYLMTTENSVRVAPGARVTPVGKIADVAVGHALLGRVISGTGRPLDGEGSFVVEDHYPLYGNEINPMERRSIDTPLDVGVRSINALATVGCGQRMGLIAPTGVGKSVLLGMMTHFTDADVIVVCLIGERGREVKQFIEDTLGAAAMKRTVAVVSPSDTSPLVRQHAALRATSIAEYFRDQGKNVLLLMDSLTRYAQALRELAFATGESPDAKSYPPSVFAKMSSLVERAGASEQSTGSITAFYTVLIESEQQYDPIAQAALSYLDGHISLSKSLADSGVYPAIDIENSTSRVMDNIVDQQQYQFARSFKHLFSIYQRSRDVINVGAYKAGNDPQLDEAITMMPMFRDFLMQKTDKSCSLFEASAQLEQLFFPVK